MNQDIVDTLWAAIGALRTIVLEAPHDAEEAKSSAVASIEAAEAWLHEQESVSIADHDKDDSRFQVPLAARRRQFEHEVKLIEEFDGSTGDLAIIVTRHEPQGTHRQMDWITISFGKQAIIINEFGEHAVIRSCWVDGGEIRWMAHWLAHGGEE